MGGRQKQEGGSVSPILATPSTTTRERDRRRKREIRVAVVANVVAAGVLATVAPVALCFTQHPEDKGEKKSVGRERKRRRHWEEKNRALAARSSQKKENQATLAAQAAESR